MSAQDYYVESFDGLVQDLSRSTGVEGDQVATILKRLSLPQTLSDFSSLSGAKPRELKADDLRIGVRVGRMLIAA